MPGIYSQIDDTDQIEAGETKGVQPERHDDESQFTGTSLKQMSSTDSKKTFFVAANCSFRISNIKNIENEHDENPMKIKDMNLSKVIDKEAMTLI